MSNPQWDRQAPIVPMDAQGNMLTGSRYNCHWVRVYDFRSTMEIVDWSPTNASVVYHLKDSKGFLYPIYAGDFFALITQKSIEKGVISEALYTFQKTGSSYGIRFTA